MAKTKVLDLSLLRFGFGLERKARLSPPGGKVKAIQEDGAEFTLEFEDGSSVTAQLADPGSSVAVRDDKNQVETSADQEPQLKYMTMRKARSGGVGKIFPDF